MILFQNYTETFTLESGLIGKKHLVQWQEEQTFQKFLETSVLRHVAVQPV